VAFPTPASGLRCGVALQRAFAHYSRSHPDEPISVRIGLHTGEAISDSDTFFGKTVIHAFRIADLAASREILVSGHLKQLVEARGSFNFADERPVWDSSPPIVANFTEWVLSDVVDSLL
jgi:class 3 adenylate cyclase